MQFGFLGIDYKNADLTIRDEISFTDQKKLEFFHKAEEIGVEQVMILSTCNRSEIYYFFNFHSFYWRLCSRVFWLWFNDD